MRRTSVRASAWRRAIPWLAGVLVCAIRGGSVELVPASGCAGLLELASIGAVTLEPTLTLGLLLSTLHAVAIVAAVGLFIELAARTTGDIAAATAAGTAIGLSPLFPSTLAPPWEAAAFAVAAAGGLALSMRTTSRALAAFAACAVLFLAIVPPSRLVWCLRPAWTARPRSIPLDEGLRAMAFVLGPLTIALAIFGAFLWLTRTGRLPASAKTTAFSPDDRLRATLIVLACLAVFALTAAPPIIAWAPILVAVWWLAAIGLHEIATMAGRAGWGRVAGVLILVLLPLLHANRRTAEERDDRVAPLGHDRIALRDTRVILDLVPSGAAFVEEEASVDILLRASVFGGRRATKPFTVVPRTREEVQRARAAGPVFAWPLGQQDLGARGFRFGELEAPSPGDHGRIVNGIVPVTGVRPCVDVETRAVDVTETLADGRIALAADSESARGPILLLLGGRSRAEPVPDTWSQRTMRGFQSRSFERPDELDADRVSAMAQELGLPRDHPLLADPFIVRLELHRTPRAPRALPVYLGGPFTHGVAMLKPTAIDAGRLSICDAPPIVVARFVS